MVSASRHHKRETADGQQKARLVNEHPHDPGMRTHYFESRLQCLGFRFADPRWSAKIP